VRSLCIASIKCSSCAWMSAQRSTPVCSTSANTEKEEARCCKFSSANSLEVWRKGMSTITAGEALLMWLCVTSHGRGKLRQVIFQLTICIEERLTADKEFIKTVRLEPRRRLYTAQHRRYFTYLTHEITYNLQLYSLHATPLHSVLIRCEADQESNGVQQTQHTDGGQ